MSRATALVLLGPSNVVVVPLLPGEPVTIGRDEKSATIVLRDRQLSRTHLRVQSLSSGMVEMVDLDSHNGTFVEGERLRGRMAREVLPGDVVMMGAHYIWGATDGAEWVTPTTFQAELERHAGGVRLFTIEGRADSSTATFVGEEGAPFSELRVIQMLRDALARLPKGTRVTRQPTGAIHLALHARDGALLSDLVSALEKMSLDLYEVPSGRSPESTPPSSFGTVTSAGIDLGRIASSDITVLIFGETGSGKEVMARHLHASSKRASGPFVAVNCGAIAESLFESELFGHERGAFTGANVARQGYLESAMGGTVLFDEVAELSSAMQVKLLRVIETRSIHRVGSVMARPLDVRFLAATLRDLPAAVAAGTFREDLYFRLSGITLRIPPLRERVEELAPIARSILRALAPGVSLSDDALQVLRAQPWPGNVRELKSVLERALLVQTDGVIEGTHLIFDAPLAPRRGESPPIESRAAAASADPRYARVADALARSAGNQRRASEMLGISRRTLTNWLSELSFPRPRKS